MKRPKPRKNGAYRRRGKRMLHAAKECAALPFAGFSLSEFLLLQQGFFDAHTRYMQASGFIEVEEVPFVPTPIR